VADTFRGQFGALDVTAHRDEEALRVAIAGELDIASVQPLRDVIDWFVRGDRCHVRVDCRDLAFIDSSGLGLFVKLHKRLRAARCSLTLVDVPKRCRRVFEITGLAEVLTIE
jgi:anti-sigma B factor antagonist